MEDGAAGRVGVGVTPDRPLRTTRFRVGQRYCCVTGQPQPTCFHCATVVGREGALPEALMVTKIDRERGEVTLSVPVGGKAGA